jgi:hypothetical protein
MTTTEWPNSCLTCLGIGETGIVTVDSSHESVWELFPTVEECRDCLGTGECPMNEGETS